MLKALYILIYMKASYNNEEACEKFEETSDDELKAYLNEAIAELEALQQRSCEGCKYGKFGADSRGIEVECTLIWHCSRGNGFPDRYEPKEQQWKEL